jgi:hypothetical protein
MILQVLLPDLERTGNLVEAGFWVIFGLILAVTALRRPSAYRTLAVSACLVSILFGLSDLVEASSGAWWRPWWLLVWKGLCITGLVLCFLRYRQLRAAASSEESITPQAPSSSM